MAAFQSTACSDSLLALAFSPQLTDVGGADGGGCDAVQGQSSSFWARQTFGRTESSMHSLFHQQPHLEPPRALAGLGQVAQIPLQELLRWAVGCAPKDLDRGTCQKGPSRCSSPGRGRGSCHAAFSAARDASEVSASTWIRHRGNMQHVQFVQNRFLLSLIPPCPSRPTRAAMSAGTTTSTRTSQSLLSSGALVPSGATHGRQPVRE